MLKQLPFQMDDDELHNQLDYLRVAYKEIRLVKHRDTGASRGFAFVEFDHVDDAQSWMDQCRVNIIFVVVGWLQYLYQESLFRSKY